MQPNAPVLCMPCSSQRVLSRVHQLALVSPAWRCKVDKVKVWWHLNLAALVRAFRHLIFQAVMFLEIFE
jgi:hypothetical protein